MGRGRLLRPVLILGVAAAITACGAGASTSPIPAPTSVITPRATPTTAATQSPEVTSTTTAAESAAPSGATSVAMTGPPPRFDAANLTVTAGPQVRFFLTNRSHGTHTFAIGLSRDRALAVSDAVLVGRSAVLTVRGLKPGAYVIWCTIDDHAAEGMVGTLNVRAP